MAARVRIRCVGYGSRTFSSGKHLPYEKMMMRQTKGQGSHIQAGSSTCRNCSYYHPDWDYRFCEFAMCKYGKPINVFRRKR